MTLWNLNLHIGFKCTLVSVFETTRCHTTQDNNVYSYRRENSTFVAYKVQPLKLCFSLDKILFSETHCNIYDSQIVSTHDVSIQDIVCVSCFPSASNPACITTISILWELRSSRRYEDQSLLGCNTVRFGTLVPTFGSSALTPSSGLPPQSSIHKVSPAFCYYLHVQIFLWNVLIRHSLLFYL
jgi:hypothetical protein